MAMSGFICHDDYYDRLKRLSNEEVGNLFRMLMLYHAGRKEEMEALGFVENEGIAFDFITSDIERMEDKHNTTVETNRANGSKGGRPKKQEEPEETEQNRQKPKKTENNRTKPTETEQNPTKPYKDKDKEKDKEKEICFIDDDNAHGIANDHDTLLSAAETAGFPKNDATRAKLIALYADHGLQKMLDAIGSCVDHGVSNLAYLSAVLKGEPKKPKGKTVNAQDYTQREYNALQDDIEQAQRREMELYLTRGTG